VTILTYLLTPWCRILFEKLIVFQLVKKYPAFLWNLKVHCCVHSSLPLHPVLSQLNPIHNIRLIFSRYISVLCSHRLEHLSTMLHLSFMFPEYNFLVLHVPPTAKTLLLYTAILRASNETFNVYRRIILISLTNLGAKEVKDFTET